MSTGTCDGPRGLPKSFLQPCLLLLLKEEPGYGYDLAIRLKTLGIHDDSAAVYRALRALETKRRVSSYWCTSSSGPARRMYRLTPAGEEELAAGVEAVVETHQAIERLFCRHALALSRPAEPADMGSASAPTAVRRLLGRTNSSSGIAAAG